MGPEKPVWPMAAPVIVMLSPEDRQLSGAFAEARAVTTETVLEFEIRRAGDGAGIRSVTSSRSRAGREKGTNEVMTDIVYCDDEAAFQSAFQLNHSNPDTHITMTSDVVGLPAFLSSMRRAPDLLILDLFHTAHPPGSPEAARVNAEVDKHLQRVDEATEGLKQVVKDGKRPAALDALHAIRETPKLARLPVLLYTRQGLSLLDDDQLNRALSLGAEWMLKGRSPEFERGRMHSFITAQRAVRTKARRELLLVILGAALAFLLERAYHFAVWLSRLV